MSFIKSPIAILVLIFLSSFNAVAGDLGYGFYKCQRGGIATQDANGDLTMQYYKDFPESPLGMSVLFDNNMIRIFSAPGMVRASSDLVSADGKYIKKLIKENGLYKGKAQFGDNFWYIAGTTTNNGFYVGGGNMITVMSDCKRLSGN